MKLKLLAEQVNMKTTLSKILNDDLLRLNTLYKKNGHTLRIVGGAVRDILSNKEPKDIDLASDATPTESMELLKSNDIKVIETGLQHGTIVAHMNGEDYEITTLRIDVETDGRHAEVEYTKDWEQDAARRDLTFNAMSMDFDGNVYDYHGGHDDLKSNTAKFVGDTDARVQEDYLRILRYFRFQGRMDSPKFDTATVEKIAANAAGLNQISGERIWSEMSKILSGKHAVAVINMMSTHDILPYTGMPGHGGDELKDVSKVTSDPNLRLAACLSNTSELDELKARWKFSNPEYNVMKFVIENRNKQATLDDMKRRYVLDMKREDNKNLLVKLLEYNGDKRAASALASWEPPKFPVNGMDVMEAGIPQGQEVRKTLYRLKTMWYDSDFKLSREQLLGEIA